MLLVFDNLAFGACSACTIYLETYKVSLVNLPSHVCRSGLSYMELMILWLFTLDFVT